MSLRSSTTARHEIRAVHDASTITVYQAYSPAIAEPSLRAQRLVPPFRLNRMTWIKPSFLWMMHRSGWATKPGQERVLAIRMSRAGFDWALSNACLTHFDAAEHSDPDAWRARLLTSPVRLQWDPERDIQMQTLPIRTVQLGLAGAAIARYAQSWVVGIDDCGARIIEIRKRLDAGDLPGARALLPAETIYTPVELEGAAMP